MVCAKHNVQGNLKPKPGKLESPIYPFEIKAMDFTELSVCQQNKYYLVIIDCFSKWVEIFTTAKADAKTVVKEMTHWILPTFGIPRLTYSDNGTHFVNQVIKEMCKILGITHKVHCAYHPQSAGLVERTNGTIKGKLRKAMAETGRNWVDCLPAVKLSMHITKGQGKLTPFEIIHGKPYV